MPKHVFQVHIRTSPEQLWHALVDPEMTARYFSGTPARCTVVEAEPPRRLVMTFAFTDGDLAGERPTRVTFEIEPHGPSCRLTLLHDDFHGTTRTYRRVADEWPFALSNLKSTLETGAPLDTTFRVPDVVDAIDTEREEHRAFGARANNRVWELLGCDTRTPADDREMVDAAHASLWHWRHAGTALNEQRGEWLVSHVYAVLGDGTAAMRHAQRCWALTEDASLDGFDLAYGAEALARAYGVLGALDDATSWRERAVAAATNVADDEDRAILEADIAAEPWPPGLGG